MTKVCHTRYVAEVVYKDDRGIWAVTYMPDLPEEQVVQLAAHEYGIRPEWVMAIRRKAVLPYKQPPYPFKPEYESQHIPILKQRTWLTEDELKVPTHETHHRDNSSEVHAKVINLEKLTIKKHPKE